MTEQEHADEINQARYKLGRHIETALAELRRANQQLSQLCDLYDVEHAEGVITRDMQHYLDTARRELMNADARRAPEV